MSATDAVVTSAGAPGAAAEPARRVPLSGAVIAVVVVLALMLLAFVTPAINSGPDDLPIGVAAPPPVSAQVTGALEKQAPGAFAVTDYATAEEVTAAIRNREVVGGIVVAPGGAQVQVAGGAGAPYAALLRNLATGMAATGQQVTVTDVAPLPEADPAGTALGGLALPLVFGGMASAALMALLVGGGAWRRIGGIAAIAVLGGLTATAILQYGFDALAGNYWLTSTGIILGIAAVSYAVMGLNDLFGRAGLAAGALLMLFVANPLSGIATGPLWLPQPWGAVGQLLPMGAAGTAVRSAAYFDGNGVGAAYVVLGCWIIGGLLLTLVGARVRRERTGPSAAPVTVGR